MTLFLSLTLALACAPVPTEAIQDPLPSWNAGATKDAILQFVTDVTAVDGPHFVPLAERIAVFDNDGTLVVEKPTYVQVEYAFDRIRQMAPAHPEWKEQQPFQDVLAGETTAALASSEEAMMDLILATSTGDTWSEFETSVVTWMATAKHPTTGRLYTRMVYQPMLELIAYLQGNGFQTYIVSGGGVDFIRPWAERIYGIVPQQVVGTSVKTQYQLQGGEPVLVRLPEVFFFDDKGGKPVSIQHHIGRRPIAAFGNSDGDLEMLQWTTAGSGRRFGLLVHHTDAEREWAYDRESDVGRLDKALDAAPAAGWTVVDMKRDWAVVFPPSPRP